jgi:hypothetical protein
MAFFQVQDEIPGFSLSVKGLYVGSRRPSRNRERSFGGKYGGPVHLSCVLRRHFLEIAVYSSIAGGSDASTVTIHAMEATKNIMQGEYAISGLIRHNDHAPPKVTRNRRWQSICNG